MVGKFVCLYKLLFLIFFLTDIFFVFSCLTARSAEIEPLERYTETISDGLDGATKDRLLMLHPSYQSKFFAFVDIFVSSVRGRPDFEVQCRAKLHLCKLVTISDIAFCLATLENQYDVWKQLDSNQGVEIATPERKRPRYTTSKGKKNNGSARLRVRYDALNEIVENSFGYCPRDALNSNWQLYIAHKLDEKDKKNATNRAPAAPKKDSIALRDLEREWEW